MKFCEEQVEYFGTRRMIMLGFIWMICIITGINHKEVQGIIYFNEATVDKYSSQDNI